MRVGVLHVDLHIEAAQSLKSKRQVLRSLKDRLSARFNVSVAEVGSQDLWQRAEIGIALVALDAKRADAALRKVEGHIRSHPGAVVLEIQRAIIDVQEDEYEGAYGFLGMEDFEDEEEDT